MQMSKYPSLSLLEKAKMERSCWDSNRKSVPEGTSRAAFLAQMLGADADSTLRSNLLKKGVNDPLLWAKLESGEVSYKDLLCKGRPSKSEDQNSSGEPLDLEAVARTLIQSAERLRELRVKQGAPRKIKVPAIPGYDALGEKLEALLLGYVKEQNFLNTNGCDLRDVLDQYLWGIRSEYETLRRNLNRIQGRDTQVNFSAFFDNGVEKSCEVLGVRYRTDNGRLTNEAYALCRKKYRKRAFKIHPDRFPNGHTREQALEWQTLNDAMTTIDNAYWRE